MFGMLIPGYLEIKKLNSDPLSSGKVGKLSVEDYADLSHRECEDRGYGHYLDLNGNGSVSIKELKI